MRLQGIEETLSDLIAMIRKLHNELPNMVKEDD